MTLEQLTEFFGWVTVINIGILGFVSITLTVFKSAISNIHSKLFDMPKSELYTLYFNYLGTYKTLMFIFAITPYIALKIMTA